MAPPRPLSRPEAGPHHDALERGPDGFPEPAAAQTRRLPTCGSLEVNSLPGSVIRIPD